MAEKSVHNDTYNTLKLNPASADTGPSSGANDGASLYPSKSVLSALRHHSLRPPSIMDPLSPRRGMEPVTATSQAVDASLQSALK